MKLFEIFTHAVKPFFVNAQSMLKWFSVHVKNGMQPNLIIVLQKSYSQSVALKVKTNKHVYSPLSYLLCVFFILCCICHITNHFCKKIEQELTQKITEPFIQQYKRKGI